MAYKGNVDINFSWCSWNNSLTIQTTARLRSARDLRKFMSLRPSKSLLANAGVKKL